MRVLLIMFLAAILLWTMMIMFHLHHKLSYAAENNNNFQNRSLYEFKTAMEKSYYLPFAPTNFSDVLIFDEHVWANIRATYEGARSFTEWALFDDPSIRRRQELHYANNTRVLAQFQTLPLQATVDRRPIIVRKQLIEDGKRFQSLTDGGKLLGCAITGSTFVSDLELLEVKNYVSEDYNPTCAVCFQFSNYPDMASFLPELEFIEQSTLPQKCFAGKATASAKFAAWQQDDPRFKGFGHQWQVDCVLPDGIKELTCREISRMQNGIDLQNDLQIQSISFLTKFQLDGWFRKPGSDDDMTDIVRPFRINAEWPWAAVTSHDDDRSAIASELSTSWNDVNSKFVPSDHHEMTLAHVEGPVFDNSFKSLNSDRDRISKNGSHPQLLASNLFHLIRNAPGSTHMIAVVDSQARRSFNAILALLNTSISELFKEHGNSVFGDESSLYHQDLIPIHKWKSKSLNDSTKGITLSDLLRMRGIKIHMLPIITPPLVFEKTVSGGQYTFTPYLAARYAADYQAMLYVDSDTALIEGSDQRTLNEIIYDRFFGPKSTKCAGHRLRLIEHYIKPEHYNNKAMLQCTKNLVLNKKKWRYAMKNCNLKIGHIVGRTDSIYAFNIHHPDTLPEYLPKGVENCINIGSMNFTPPYPLEEDEVVQLHLRNRQRKAECSCET